MFSYGSGLTSTMFSFRLQEGQHPFNLLNIVTVLNVSGKLKQRVEVCVFDHLSILALSLSKKSILAYERTKHRRRLCCLNQIKILSFV